MGDTFSSLRGALLLLVVAALFAFLPTAANAAPPANDDFANAEVLSGSTDSASGTNVEATLEAGEPNHAGTGAGGGASIWYWWQAPSSGEVSVDTCGSDFDTLLGVYTGSAVNTLSEVASADDAGGCAPQSAVLFNATAGTTYRIAVDGWAGATGAVELDLAPAPVEPPDPPDTFFADVVASGSSASVKKCNNAATKFKKAKKKFKKAKKKLKQTGGSKDKKSLKQATKKLKKTKKAKRRACTNRAPKFQDPVLRSQRARYNYLSGILVGATLDLKLTPATDPDGDLLTYTWAAARGSVCAFTIPWDCPKSSSQLPAARLGLRAYSGVVESPGNIWLTVTDGRGGKDKAVLTSAP